MASLMWMLAFIPAGTTLGPAAIAASGILLIVTLFGVVIFGAAVAIRCFMEMLSEKERASIVGMMPMTKSDMLKLKAELEDKVVVQEGNIEELKRVVAERAAKMERMETRLDTAERKLKEAEERIVVLEGSRTQETVND